MAKSSASSLSKSVQDYLKVIFELEQAGEEASTMKVCASLNHIKPASVTGMFKHLAQLELVRYIPYSGVQLTNQGKHHACKVLRAHRLLELYLVHKIGFTPDQVHTEAEALEHVISDEFIACIDLLLGAPQVGVHGEPIPQLTSNIQPQRFEGAS